MQKDTVYLDPLSQEEIEYSHNFAVMGGKGGTSKTTTAFNAGLYLVRAGQSCLEIDMDTQCNLTQRTGIPDGEFEENRISELFLSMRSPVYMAQRKRIPVLVKLPYLFKLPGSEKRVGKLAIIPGSPNALLDARSAYGKSIDSSGTPKMYEIFNDTLKEYKKHYGNIVMDLGPNLNGNELAMLAVRTADVIIVPIDSIYAAYGIKQLLQFIGEQVQMKENCVYPKIVFVMTKYHPNMKAADKLVEKIAEDENDEDDIEEAPIQNSVYVALKKVFGYNVCDNGVKETKKLRATTYGRLGKNNEYISPMAEIMKKLKEGLPDIFEYWNNSTINLLNEELNAIEERAKEMRKPEFIRTIVYNTTPRADYGSRKQANLKGYFVQEEEFSSSFEGDKEPPEDDVLENHVVESTGFNPEDIYDALTGNAAAFKIQVAPSKRKYTRRDKK